MKASFLNTKKLSLNLTALDDYSYHIIKVLRLDCFSSMAHPNPFDCGLGHRKGRHLPAAEPALIGTQHAMLSESYSPNFAGLPT